MKPGYLSIPNRLVRLETTIPAAVMLLPSAMASSSNQSRAWWSSLFFQLPRIATATPCKLRDMLPGGGIGKPLADVSERALLSTLNPRGAVPPVRRPFSFLGPQPHPLHRPSPTDTGPQLPTPVQSHSPCPMTIFGPAEAVCSSMHAQTPTGSWDRRRASPSS